MDSKPTLGYWNIRGLAHGIRFVLTYSKVDFNDKRYDYGPAPEFHRDSWNNEKFTLGLPFPNLPYFIDGEAKITETLAIYKYICHKFNPELLGKDPK